MIIRHHCPPQSRTWHAKDPLQRHLRYNVLCSLQNNSSLKLNSSQSALWGYAVSPLRRPLKVVHSALSTQPSLSPMETATNSAERTKRLAMLVELRRLYRNIVRAQVLTSYSSPIYRPTPPAEGEIDEEKAKELEIEEQERRKITLDTIAEMQLTSEELKASLRSLPSELASLFAADDSSESFQRIITIAKEYANALRARVNQELPHLTFFTSEAERQAALDARNSKFLVAGRFVDAYSNGKPLNAMERLEAAEKVAGQFVERKIKPVLRRAREADILESAQRAGTYLKGLWVRLNGGGGSDSSGLLYQLGLPLPLSTARDSDVAISTLSLELDSLEGQLQDASKARERQVRGAGVRGRVQMAITLKMLDAQVLKLSRMSAVRALQLEAEFTYRSLEDEILDFYGDVKPGDLLPREGTTFELALLVAEFGMLDEQLTVLAAALEDSALSLLGDEILERLAVEIPDLRMRVGVGDREVFGGKGFSITKAQLQAVESIDKVREAITFLIRGLRLLGSDMGTAGRLFSRAAFGVRLTQREVSGLRRTARDILTFVPFIIILIIPLSPLGHVLVFSFIQRYFPSLFPSCFTMQRQEIMARYEELRQQLLDARSKAEQEEEKAELTRAAQAVAQLIAPETKTRTQLISAALTENTDLGAEMIAASVMNLEDGKGADVFQNVKRLEAEIEQVIASRDGGDVEESGRGLNGTYKRHRI